MKKRIVLLWALCMYGFFAAAPVYSIDTILFDNDVIAIVNDQSIDIEEFENSLTLQRKEGNVRQVLDTLTFEGRNKALTKLIDTKLLAVEARQQKLDNVAAVRRKIDRAVEQILADAIIHKEIEQLDLKPDTLKKYYASHPQFFTANERVKARHIVTKTRDEALQALAELKQGKDFSEIASERNIDSSKAKGGLLGWVYKGLMVKSFEDSLFRLDEGQVSGIVRTAYGYHIIKAEKVDAGEPEPFESVIEKVRAKIIEQHLSDFKAKLNRKYKVQINTELLKDMNETE